MQMHQSVMDVQHLGPSTTLAVINEHLIVNEWLDEVRKAFRERLNRAGGTNWKNDVRAEDLDQVLRQIFLINDDDWIEASPHSANERRTARRKASASSARIAQAIRRGR